MKRLTYPMPICFCLGLLLMGVVAWLVSAMLQAVPALMELHWIILLIPAVRCSVGALIAHRCAKGRTAAYLLSYGANAIGSGWTGGGLMGMKGILPAMTLVQALLPALFIGILCWVLLATIDYWPGIITLFFAILSVALVITGFVIWVKVMPLMGCTMVFSALFLLPFPISVNVAMDDTDDTIRYLSFSGFGAFILILFVVVLILTEGEGAEGFEAFGEIGFDALDVRRRRR